MVQTPTQTNEHQHTFTRQQLRAARLAADGLSINEIANEMDLSPRTVKHHLDMVKARLGITHKRHIRQKLKELNLL